MLRTSTVALRALGITFALIVAFCVLELFGVDLYNLPPMPHSLSYCLGNMVSQVVDNRTGAEVPLVLPYGSLLAHTGGFHDAPSERPAGVTIEFLDSKLNRASYNTFDYIVPTGEVGHDHEWYVVPVQVRNYVIQKLASDDPHSHLIPPVRHFAGPLLSSYFRHENTAESLQSVHTGSKLERDETTDGGVQVTMKKMQ